MFDKYFLIIISLLFFLIAFVWRLIAFKRLTGKNALVFGLKDNVYNYVGRWMLVLALAAGTNVFIFTFCPSLYIHLQPLTFLEKANTALIGEGLLLFSLVMMVTAQSQMGKSFRMGIEHQIKTDLIHQGIFKLSRNPIYLAMLFGMAGFFCMTPNFLSLIILVLGYFLLQVQVRLEEEYLFKKHGDEFEKYRQKVRRWL